MVVLVVASSSWFFGRACGFLGVFRGFHRDFWGLFPHWDLRGKSADFGAGRGPRRGHWRGLAHPVTRRIGGVGDGRGWAGNGAELPLETRQNPRKAKAGMGWDGVRRDSGLGP